MREPQEPQPLAVKKPVRKNTRAANAKKVSKLKYALVGVTCLTIGVGAGASVSVLQPPPPSQIVHVTRTPKSCYVALNQAENLVSLSAKSISLASKGLEAMAAGDTEKLQQTVTDLGQLTGPLTTQTQNYVKAAELCRGTSADTGSVGDEETATQ